MMGFAFNTIIFLILVQGAIFGSFCAFIATDKNRDSIGWFLLGFCFSFLPLLALVALSRLEDTEPSHTSDNPAAKPEPEEPARERDLSLDSYKIWLVSQYSIERNDALASFVCVDKLFPTIEAALEYADFLDREKSEQLKQQRETEENTKLQHQAEAQMYEKERKDTVDGAIIWGPTLVLAFIILWVFLA